MEGPRAVAIECRVVPKDCPVRSHAPVDGLYLIENMWLIKTTKASRLPTIQREIVSSIQPYIASPLDADGGTVAERRIDGLRKAIPSDLDRALPL